MKKKLVRIVSLVLCLVIFSALCVSANAMGGSAYPSLSATNYCEFISPKRITVYRDKGFKKVGTCSPAETYDYAHIAKGDDCRIYEITSSYIKVNYPTPNDPKIKRRTGYIKRSELYNMLQPVEPYAVCTTDRYIDTYKSANGDWYGHTDPNDTIWICRDLDNWPSWFPIIYTAKNGNQGYKLGWIKWNDYFSK